MHITFNDVISAISAIAALVASYHAVMGNRKSTTIKANVNGNMERLVDILANAAITIPHSTATKVVSAPPADIPADADPETRLTLEWLQKIGKDGLDMVEHDNPQ